MGVRNHGVSAIIPFKWYDRRDEDSLAIKMNTGSGKTVVGLLILKSCLNEGKSPAVYVCPGKYLVKQVIDAAKELAACRRSEVLYWES